MTGGILRSRALGNVYNLADEMDIVLDSDPIHPAGKVYTHCDPVDSDQICSAGKVHVYTTHCDPSDLKPYLLLKHPVTKTLAPVLKKLGVQISPVKTKYCLNL